MSASIDEADMARCIAFLDGTLAHAAHEDFLARLAAEPALASELDRIAAIDDALRARPRPRIARSRPRWAWAVAAVAAALVAALFAIAPWKGRRGGEVEARVALLASDESPLEWIRRHPGVAALRPPGIDELRGANEPTNVAAGEFVDRARDAALDDATTSEVASGYFRVAIVAGEPSSVLLVAVPERGPAVRLFPPDLVARDAAERARVGAGRHVLPAEPFALVESSGSREVSYDRGFLVPIGAGRLWVLAATRARAVGADDVASLDTELARGGSGDEVARWLSARSFTVATLVVREPR